jgi:hypothetical protein
MRALRLVDEKNEEKKSRLRDLHFYPMSLN